MKVVIKPAEGTIEVDIADDSSGAQFVRELMSGALPAPEAPKAIEAKRPRKRGRPRKKDLAPPRADRPLTRIQDETWAWLAASDRPDGVTIDEVAQAFGLSHAGAGWRLNQLVRRDMAWRIAPGRYRVGSVTDAILTNGARA